VKIGRFGPVIQIGSAEDEEKPRFAQLPKGLSMDSITLEEALESFKLPRTLGEFEDSTITVGVGKFGPYVRHNTTFVSIPKDTDPMAITLEEAIDMLKSKREAAENKVIKTFDEEPELQILNGRYGPYIAYQKKNYKIPETVEPKDLNLEACFNVIELQKAKGETPKRRYPAKKK
jgi:DNA topoisomerase-1